MYVGEKLEVVRDLFAGLAHGDVAFVHWKSNEHLAAALRGETDLDLLVDVAARDRFVAIVSLLGFLPMLPPRERAIPGLDSFLGMDQATGTLVHLDVHYRVVLGEQFLKNHHLPVERWLLSSPATLEGVAVPRAGQELVLLYVRCVLKTRSRQIARAIVKGGSPLPERIRKEAWWLAKRVDEDSLEETVAGSGLDLTASEVSEFRLRALEDRLDWRYLVERKRSLGTRLRRFERLPWYRVAAKRVWMRFRTGRAMRAIGLGLPRRHLGFAAPVIASVGADGSGKTRLTRDLQSWLEAKLVVRHLYFGQPKTGLVFKALNKPGSMARGRDESGHPWPLLERVAVYTDAAKWLMLAERRRSLARRARVAAARGEVVIAERYPIADFFDMEVPIDGPRLQPDGPLSRFEMAQYRAIPAPDLTIVLDASVQVLRDRKLDLTLDEHVAKVEAVKALGESPNRVMIDAALPYEDVLARAKSVVWEALLARR
jgi:thymidylate kinase